MEKNLPRDAPARRRENGMHRPSGMPFPVDMIPLKRLFFREKPFFSAILLAFSRFLLYNTSKDTRVFLRPVCVRPCLSHPLTINIQPKKDPIQ
jgi:hypothetical protein